MSRKKTTEEFVNESKKLYGNKYDYSLTNYVRNNIKVKIICPIHGMFEIRPNDHFNKNVSCNKCNNAGIVKSKNYSFNLIKNFNKKHNFKYDYSLFDYHGADKKIKIICPTHGIFEQISKHHLNGRGCPKCVNVARLTNEEFILKSKKVHGEKYDYTLVNYINYTTKVNIICPKHGTFQVIPQYHIHKKIGCPICKESKGEKVIRIFLVENSIKFIPQKRFKECKDKKSLPFDFYLPNLNICIEYDGEQHYSERYNFGGKNRLLDIQKKDKIKNEYCLKNNIHLVRIKYNDNIVEKLNLIKKYELD